MTPGINLVSMRNDMINWVWCEDCLEWKNAGEDVAFISIDEDKFGKDGYNKAINSDEKSQVLNYLNNKYKIY